MVANLVNQVRFITRSGIKDYNSNILKIRHKRHNNSNIEYLFYGIVVSNVRIVITDSEINKNIDYAKY